MERQPQPDREVQTNKCQARTRRQKNFAFVGDDHGRQKTNLRAEDTSDVAIDVRSRHGALFVTQQSDGVWSRQESYFAL